MKQPGWLNGKYRSNCSILRRGSCRSFFLFLGCFGCFWDWRMFGGHQKRVVDFFGGWKWWAESEVCLYELRHNCGTLVEKIWSCRTFFSPPVTRTVPFKASPKSLVLFRCFWWLRKMKEVAWKSEELSPQPIKQSSSQTNNQTKKRTTKQTTVLLSVAKSG